MLGVIALAWGVLAWILTGAAYIPCLSFLNWVDLPFAVVGAVLGLTSVFMESERGSKNGIIGTALCMIASLAGIFRLILTGPPT